MAAKFAFVAVATWNGSLSLHSFAKNNVTAAIVCLETLELYDVIETVNILGL